MNEFMENLKRQAEEQPIVALGVAAALLTALGKMVNAQSWARETRRRERMSKKK